MFLWITWLFYNVKLTLFPLCRINGRKVRVHTLSKFNIFKIVYNPCQHSRTIYDVTLYLKCNVTKTNPKTEIPTCEFGLDFRMPFPQWFHCGSLSTWESSFNKLSYRVISNKYDIDNYKGALRIDLEHVRILSTERDGEIKVLVKLINFFSCFSIFTCVECFSSTSCSERGKEEEEG